jgi:AraC-like DNA-binding protein
LSVLGEAFAPALGRLRHAGAILDGRGIPVAPSLRVYGSYALVGVTRGAGSYRDAAGITAHVNEGDTILVFPERAHWYGPPPGRRWDEIHLTFEGPVFDLYRRAGVLDDARPIRRAPNGWMPRLEAVVGRFVDAPVSAHRGVADILELLHALLLEEAATAPPLFGRTGWIDQARASLEINLEKPLDLAGVAAQAGVSYETFRKNFQRAVGVSPAHYRTQRRIAAARELLRYSPGLTNRHIANSLGFADEYHFSRRFKQFAGVTPREARRAGAVPRTVEEEIIDA